MSSPTRPPQQRIAGPCPYCQRSILTIDIYSGWIQHAMFGTRVGTYPDLPPADGYMAAHLESFPDLDRYVARPCGCSLSPDHVRAFGENATGGPE